MGAHDDTSLAAVGLAVLVLAAVGWRACTGASPSPAASISEPTTAVRAAAGAPVRTDAASLQSCTEPGPSAAACATGLADAGDQEPSADELERLARVDPSRALAWIARADLRDGQQVEARAALEVRALVGLQRIGSAQAKLQHFAEHYPDSSELPALVRLTGYHPRPPLRRPGH